MMSVQLCTICTVLQLFCLWIMLRKLLSKAYMHRSQFYLTVLHPVYLVLALTSDVLIQTNVDIFLFRFMSISERYVTWIVGLYCVHAFVRHMSAIHLTYIYPNVALHQAIHLLTVKPDMYVVVTQFERQRKRQFMESASKCGHYLYCVIHVLYNVVLYIKEESTTNLPSLFCTMSQDRRSSMHKL